jgi:hypothetical protein
MKKQSFFIKYLIQKQTPSYISSNSMPRNPIPHKNHRLWWKKNLWRVQNTGKISLVSLERKASQGLFMHENSSGFKIIKIQGLQELLIYTKREVL